MFLQVFCCWLKRFAAVVRQTIRRWVAVVLADSANEKNHPDKSPSDVWLRPNLRVRIVDDRYRHGKYYKTKVQHSFLLMPATHAQETCFKHWCKSSDIRNFHVCRSIWYKFFFCYYFLAHNRTQLYSSTETVRHVTRTVQRDWPESCFCARSCDELASNFSCKFLV